MAAKKGNQYRANYAAALKQQLKWIQRKSVKEFSKAIKEQSIAIYDSLSEVAVGIKFDIAATTKRADKELVEGTKYFVTQVFKDSQKLVPIDKRYFGRIGVTELKRNIRSEVPFVHIKNGAATSMYGVRQKSDYSQLYERAALSRIPLNRKKGFYSSKNDQIRTLESVYGAIGRGKRMSVAVGKDKNIYVKSAHDKTGWRNIGQLEPKPAMYHKDYLKKRKYTTKEIGGGNKELKQSGKITEDGLAIEYSAKSKYNERFDYAIKQHDDLTLKHLSGKRAQFVTYAYEQRVEKLKEEYSRRIKNIIIKEATK